MVDRTQALVLGFFVMAVTSLLAILAAAPEVYDQALRLPTGNRAMEIAFLAGVLRVPVAILQLTGVLAADGPGWYVSFQGLLGVLQVTIGLAMVAGYRRAGVWGAFWTEGWAHRAPEWDLWLTTVQLALLGQRRGRCPAFLYLRLP